VGGCSYCGSEVIWIPTLEGFRPFQPPVPLPPTAPVVVLDRHDCEERKQALKGAQKDFAQHLAHDPIIRQHALSLECPRCGAAPGASCFDLRAGAAPGKTNKNPHQQRLIEGARVAQET
jgi:hypothetical protein